MALIETQDNQPWSNYHLTIGDRTDPATLAPYLLVERLATITGIADGTADAMERMHDSARAIQDYLAAALAALDPGAECAISTVGQAWSFADLIGSPRLQFDARGLAHCGSANPAELHPACPVQPGHIVFAGGGTRLRAIANWAAARGLMIANSGTHLGPTIAGGTCTASHGSRLGWGGLQDMVRGMHLITGPDSSVWIERADCPVLSDTAVAALDTRLIRDTAIFQDALIHLGAMGIVNAVAVELVERDLYHQVRADAPLDGEWDSRIREGKFAAISDAIMQHHSPGMVGKTPVFYELTINPFDYRSPSALHTFYYAAPDAAAEPDATARGVQAGDAVVGYIQKILDTPALVQALQPALWNMDDASDWPDEMPRDAFEYYRVEGQFTTKHEPDTHPALDWSQLHPTDEITSGLPGALYNASFAVERHRLPEALQAITQAVIGAGLPPTFIFTARFVTAPAGTMAFTRFIENAVIEIDGVSPWIMKVMAKKYPSFAPTANQLQMAVRDGALLVRSALEEAGIAYSMHWAKLGELDAAKIEADFGPSGDPSSPLARWRATRDALLSPEARRIFWNDAIVRYGLIDRPGAGGQG